MRGKITMKNQNKEQMKIKTKDERKSFFIGVDEDIDFFQITWMNHENMNSQTVHVLKKELTQLIKKVVESSRDFSKKDNYGYTLVKMGSIGVETVIEAEQKNGWGKSYINFYFFFGRAFEEMLVNFTALCEYLGIKIKK